MSAIAAAKRQQSAATSKSPSSATTGSPTKKRSRAKSQQKQTPKTTAKSKSKSIQKSTKKQQPQQDESAASPMATSPEPELPEDYQSQKDLLLRYRPPVNRCGKQILRLPTCNPSSSGSSTLDSDEAEFDCNDSSTLELNYVEIYVNNPTSNSSISFSSALNNNGFSPAGSAGSYDYDEDDDYEFYNNANFDDEQHLMLNSAATGHQGVNFDGCEEGSEEDESGITSYLERLFEQRMMEMETPEQREERLERKRDKMKRYYEAESDEQRVKRLQKAREYKRQQKVKLEKVETPEQRMERLRKQRERQRRFYARETEEQRNRRLNKVREYQRKRKEERIHGHHPSGSSGGALRVGGAAESETDELVMLAHHDGRLHAVPAHLHLKSTQGNQEDEDDNPRSLLEMNLLEEGSSSPSQVQRRATADQDSSVPSS